MGKEEKSKVPKIITILEDWVEIEGTVFYRWKLPEEESWHYKKTPYKQKPIVQFKYMAEEEFGWLSESRKDEVPDWREML